MRLRNLFVSSWIEKTPGWWSPVPLRISAMLWHVQITFRQFGNLFDLSQWHLFPPLHFFSLGHSYRLFGFRGFELLSNLLQVLLQLTAPCDGHLGIVSGFVSTCWLQLVYSFIPREVVWSQARAASFTFLVIVLRWLNCLSILVPLSTEITLSWFFLCSPSNCVSWTCIVETNRDLAALNRALLLLLAFDVLVSPFDRRVVSVCRDSNLILEADISGDIVIFEATLEWRVWLSLLPRLAEIAPRARSNCNCAA